MAVASYESEWLVLPAGTAAAGEAGGPEQAIFEGAHRVGLQEQL